MKLRQKFFLSYFFIISVFSLVFVCCLSFFFSTQSRNELLGSAEKTCAQTAALLDYQYRQYLYSLYIISNSEEVTHAVEQVSQDVASSIGRQYVEQLRLREILQRSILPLPDATVRLYVDNAYSNVIDHRLLENIPSPDENSWLEDFRNQRGQTMWLPTLQKDPWSGEETATLSLFRKVGQGSDWIVELYVRQSDLSKTLAAANPLQKGGVFLHGKDGALLCRADAISYDAFLDVYTPLCEDKENHWQTFSCDGLKFYCYCVPIPSAEQFLTLLLPEPSFPLSLRLLPRYAFWILAGFIIVSVGAAHFFTNTFSRRLLRLDAKMSALCAGDLNTRIEEKGNDEVAHLFRSFNHMAGEMKLLVQQQYENGIRVKTAELNALQAQINPHFLYNTLELINWKAMENDSPEIVRIAQDLADFYRLTLSNGKSMVPLQDELSLICRYLDIQNFRFSRDIRFLTEIPEDCLGITIPRLTLQPLVENSVLHGFLKRDEEDGTENLIFLRAQRDGEFLVLFLTDNGPGMTAKQFETILEGPSESSGHGFGVPNIQDRIRLLYGRNCGLTFSAAEDGGVSVTIRLAAGQS